MKKKKGRQKSLKDEPEGKNQDRWTRPTTLPACGTPLLHAEKSQAERWRQEPKKNAESRSLDMTDNIPCLRNHSTSCRKIPSRKIVSRIQKKKRTWCTSSWADQGPEPEFTDTSVKKKEPETRIKRERQVPFPGVKQERSRLVGVTSRKDKTPRSKAAARKIKAGCG